MLLVAIVILAGCATSDRRNPKDPLEPLNRKVFAFNDELDTHVLRPIATGYVNVTPLPARVGTSNFFGNLEDVWIGVNNLLQGKPGDAASDAGRFLVNSTVGILGFFDVASELGIEKHDEDFGQTLGRWGVGNGPYLVLPFFGPRTLRDTGGLIVDSYASPLGAIQDIPVRNSVRGLKVVNDRANLLGAETTLTEAALDKYSFVRDFYLKHRQSQILDGKRPKDDDDDDSMLAPLFQRVDGEGYFATRRLTSVLAKADFDRHDAVLDQRKQNDPTQ
ncbi:MAG TPA: VacJ family lipoprotein [Rhodocyclaceae bacterium]|nr:VacJ family lipoprotein [Rhodocyclaceae bacterium]